MLFGKNKKERRNKSLGIGSQSCIANLSYGNLSPRLNFKNAFWKIKKRE